MRSRIVRASALFLILLLSATATSCSGWDSFTSLLGFDTRDYSGENVIADRLGDAELEAAISDQIAMLTMNEPFLAEFSSSSEAISKCRDSVLNHMLDKNFSRYTGNIELLDAAAREYPQIKITNLIPAAEFDQTYYRAFGGATKIMSTSGEYFSYLEKLDAYTALSNPLSPEFEVVFSRLEETEHTYRATLSATVNGVASPEYNVTLIKRDDGTMYFRSVVRS